MAGADDAARGGRAVEDTRSAYDHGAEAFAEQTKDRGKVLDAARRFAAAVGDGARVLDVGCGPGHDSDLLRGLGLATVGLELSAGMLAVAHRDHPGPLVRADMRALPFRDGVCDGLWANASLLHVPRGDAAATLQEFTRALRPGGTLWLSVKEGEGERLVDATYPGMPPRWFTFWDGAELDAALAAAGLDVVDGQRVPGADKIWLTRLVCRP